MEIKIEDGKVKVQSEYNTSFIKGARLIGGKWKPPYWVFSQEDEKLVRALCMDVYGQDGGTPSELVAIDIDLDSYPHDASGELLLGSMSIARRSDRDCPVKLSVNVVLVAGGFPDSGGSANHPRIAEKPGTVLRVKNVPKPLYERIEDKTGLSIVDGTIDRAALLAEREALTKRLAEIEAVLTQEG